MTPTQEKEFKQLKEEFKQEIKEATASAAKLLADANINALKLVSDATIQASKALSETAVETARALANKPDSDHDQLIELKVLMKELKEDIKDLKTGTSMKIEDHESRIKGLELKTSNYTITIVLYSLAVVAMISLIVYHILQN